MDPAAKEAMDLDREQSYVKYVDESIDVERDFHFLRFEFLQRLNLLAAMALIAGLITLSPCPSASTQLEWKPSQEGTKT